MRREELVDLNAFATVAEEQNFTRAAAKLGTSQSALSHTINRLEARVGVRLLTRTTRKVAPTEAGERMLRALGPALDAIAEALASARELREKPAGTIRITTSEHAAHAVLWPALQKLLPNYPDVHVELVIESGFTDIVAERFDAGVRLGESIAKDMVAVRIGPDLRMAVVGRQRISRRSRNRERRRIWPIMSASICGCRRPAGSMHGNCKRGAENSTFASMDNWRSTTSP